MGERGAKIRFWGVRGSLSTGNSSYGSNTSCVELDLLNGHSIFFDAGSGIRAATVGREFKKITLCVSHFHWDHIQGLPYAGPANLKDVDWEIYTGFDDMKERFDVLFDPRFHPIDMKSYLGAVKMDVLKAGEVYDIDGLKLGVAPLNHPGLSYAFKVSSNVSSFSYATDSDYDPLTDEAQELLRDSSICVMDSQFLIGDGIEKAHYGHASFKHAIDTAAKLDVKRCFLFHFDPNYSDEKLDQVKAQANDYVKTTYASSVFPVEMAKEGLELDIVF